MRTKTLLLAAAALAVSLVTSQAQSPVYSANVVGYITFPLANGYTLIGNQLPTDTTGTNNNVLTVFGTNLPVNAAVLAWSPSAGSFYPSATWINSKGTLKWTGDTNDVDTALQSGQGVFVQVPGSTNLTIVGNVVQGTNIYSVTAGYNLVSFNAPIAGGITTVLGYSPTVGDNVLLWDPVGQGYTAPYSYINSKGTLKWSPSEPQVNVGQAVFIQSVNAKSWTNTFTVQ